MVASNLVIDSSAFTVSLLDGRTCNLRFPKVDALVSLNLDDGVVPWCGPFGTHMSTKERADLRLNRWRVPGLLERDKYQTWVLDGCARG